MFASNFLIEITALIAGWWAVDRGIADQRRAAALRRRITSESSESAVLLIGLISLVAALFVPWPAWGSTPVVLLPATIAALVLAWKAATHDRDPVFPEQDGLCRLLGLLTAAGVPLSPVILLLNLLLLAGDAGTWEHHASLPRRILITAAAWGTLAAISQATGLAAFQSPAVLVFFLMTLLISHYLITALAKVWLGPRWFSWAIDNRLHHLAASAWSWGWARFITWPRWLRVIRTVRRVEIPLQAAALGLELLAPLALMQPSLAIGFCIAWAAFHFGVFLLSGLLFWEWIACDIAVAATIAAAPAESIAPAFGLSPMLLSLLILAVFPLRHRLWKPMPLGWWDTPLTQRMHWLVEGASGKRYEVYNNFMCPHERLYGKVHGCFLAPVDAMTYHLGEVWKWELRDAIRRAGPDREQLDAVRHRFGIRPRNPDLAHAHRVYLQRFFASLNDGAAKSVLPTWLALLKAPGGQIYYWGDLPAYRRQEPVVRVRIVYREEYFDGDRLHRLRDECVADLRVNAAAATVACVPEPSPKAIDAFLLRYAAGRIIDLPRFGRGFVTAQDGPPDGAAA